MPPPPFKRDGENASAPFKRGGALTSGFDIAEIDNNVPLKLSEEQLWDNYTYFIALVAFSVPST